jgi:hypothetical protein
VVGVASLDGSATSGADLLERADRNLAERKRALGTPPVAAG